MAKQYNEKHYLELWNKYRDNLAKATPLDLNETPLQKSKRVADLEKKPEAWFKFYFPNFYTSEPANFHINATKRVLQNPEWYEIRSWSRELSKSGRTMMEVLFLTLTGKKKNVLLISNTLDNAARLLLPYRAILELNNRTINDYGVQASIGKWEATEFTTRKGVAFRALGAGQSPRGTRNDAFRPDTILIDDIDTDEECRNSNRIKQKVKWIEEALIPTRSISSHLLIIACGNIIAKYCCITEMAKKADVHEIINIRGKNGLSSWPQKNTEAHITRVLSMISANAAQKEYFNNPVSDGDIFKELNWGVCPLIAKCDQVVVYADPSTSNKDKGNASAKAVIIVGYKALQFFVYRVWLNQMSNSKFVDCLYEAHAYLCEHQVDTKKIYIENNSLQDPFYQQVILPLINMRAKTTGFHLPIIPDGRKKPDKFFRIEGTLEPINRLGNLIFNVKLQSDPDMVRMSDQMLGVSENAKQIDGPDGLEGGVWIILNREHKKNTTYSFGARVNMKY